MKKGELEAVHQLSKNRYVHVGDAYSIVSKNEPLEKSFTGFNLVNDQLDTFGDLTAVGV